MAEQRLIALGFAILFVAFGLFHAITGDIILALCFTCVVLVCLPPSIDPAIQIKNRQIDAGTHPES